jgi:TolB-like protein/Flp pilus assembly protein TadD
MTEDGQFTLDLLGPFRLLTSSGERIDIPSKKGVALIAMLAMAKNGERTRGWVQERLWGTRRHAEARGSLRRELSNLRRHLNRRVPPLLICERDRIRLRLELIRVDARLASDHTRAGDFLEGLDIAGEDGFEDWLRAERRALAERGETAQTQSRWPGELPKAPESPELPLPQHIIDTSRPPAGFDGKPALAVMPFVNATGDSELDYLAEGISEELIDRLSRIRWLPVISRRSSFSVPQGLDRSAASKILGAKYFVEGHVRREREGYRITACLAEAGKNHTLWYQGFVLDKESSKDTLGQLVTELVSHLESRIDHTEQLQTRAKRQDSSTVTDLIWRGRWHLNRLTREDSEIAQKLFAKALELDPDSAEALIQATFALGWAIWAGRQSRERVLEMRKLARDAIYADGDDGRGYMLAGIAEMWLQHALAARALFRQAIALNPSLALAHAHMGGSFNLTGEPSEAIVHLKAALRLNSNDSQMFYALTELAVAYTMLGKWSDAVEHAEYALAQRPAYWYAHVVKINALARNNSLPAARAALDELLSVKPAFSRRYLDWIPFVDRVWIDHFVQGLAMVAGDRAHILKPDTAELVAG